MYPRKIALIDVGTLKVKVQLREYVSETNMSILYQTSIRTALGRDWTNNCITDEALQATIKAIKDSVAEMNKFGKYTLQAVGTEALRKADNGQVVLAEIKNNTGLSLELLSQEKEADLFFKAVGHDFPNRPIVTIDVGGGSAQVVVSNQPHQSQSFLFPTGTYGVRTEYINGENPTQAGFLAARQHIFNTLLPLKNVVAEPAILIVGSTIALDFFQLVLPALNLTSQTTIYPNHPLTVTAETMSELLNKLALLPYSDREKLFTPEPAYTWGVDITLLHVLAVCEYLPITEIIPSNHNLSSGLFINILGTGNDK
ncbi:MAG: hypothetical protein RLZZ230_564 [Candidatus Parcubacteria bacterium]|jgi:exopolyphosphatase/pppGpp-phosphohydrolase